MKPLYHIQPDPQRKPSAKEDKLILDISLDHLAICCFQNDELIYMDFFQMNSIVQDASVDQLSTILSDHSLLEMPFENVKVIYHTPESILVPNTFYHADTSDHLLHWQKGDAGNYFPMKDSLNSSGIQLLYAVPEELHHIVTVHIPNATFVHAHSAAIVKKDISVDPSIHIQVYPNEWICSFWKDQKLQLIKTIIPVSADDLCYDLLNICKELNIPTVDAVMNICGLIEVNHEFVTGISRFFKTIVWNESNLGTDLPKHFFTAIINQSLCEL